MTRAQLILETLPGSLIAYADFKTFNFRKAISIILKDEAVLLEVCERHNLNPAMLEAMMTAQIDETIARAIGKRLEETMNDEVELW